MTHDTGRRADETGWQYSVHVSALGLHPRQRAITAALRPTGQTCPAAQRNRRAMAQSPSPEPASRARPAHTRRCTCTSPRRRAATAELRPKPVPRHRDATGASPNAAVPGRLARPAGAGPPRGGAPCAVARTMAEPRASRCVARCGTVCEASVPGAAVRTSLGFAPWLARHAAPGE